MMRMVNVKQIFHHWEKWECVKSGLYETSYPSLPKDEAIIAYGIFLCDLELFDKSITNVFDRWPISCEQFLTNKNFNRVAWLGQAAMCINSGIPRIFRSGYKLLNSYEQSKADKLAHNRICKWLENYE